MHGLWSLSLTGQSTAIHTWPVGSWSDHMLTSRYISLIVCCCLWRWQYHGTDADWMKLTNALFLRNFFPKKTSWLHEVDTSAVLEGTFFPKSNLKKKFSVPNWRQTLLLRHYRILQEKIFLKTFFLPSDNEEFSAVKMEVAEQQINRPDGRCIVGICLLNFFLQKKYAWIYKRYF